MALPIRLKRGSKASVPATALSGEPIIALDTNELFFGNNAGNTVPLKIDVINIIGLNKASANGVASLDAGAKVPVAQLPAGTANGVASLDGSGKIPSAQLPAISIGEKFTAGSQAAMLALTGAGIGDICVRSDLSNHVFLLTGTYSVLADWVDLSASGSGVTTVNGQAGPSVTLTSDHISEGSTNKWYTDARVQTYLATIKGAANGVVPLDASSKISDIYLPTIDGGTF